MKIIKIEFKLGASKIVYKLTVFTKRVFDGNNLSFDEIKFLIVNLIITFLHENSYTNSIPRKK